MKRVAIFIILLAAVALVFSGPVSADRGHGRGGSHLRHHFKPHHSFKHHHFKHHPFGHHHHFHHHHGLPLLKHFGYPRHYYPYGRPYYDESYCNRYPYYYYPFCKRSPYYDPYHEDDYRYYRNHYDPALGPLLGGVIGGAIGYRLGGGDPIYTGIGAVTGAVIGHEIDD